MDRSNAETQADYRLAAGLLTATGLAALGHQLLWTRRMIDLLGASNESTVRVFVCFFLGLALGSACAAVLIPRVERPWRFLAGVELGVAVTCVPFIGLPQVSGWVWPLLGPHELVSGAGVLVKTALSLVLLLPPAFLMGMTLPLMVSTVCRTSAAFSRRAIWFYALNMLGGVFGLILVVGITIHQLGVAGSMILLVCVNLFVAAKCYQRSRLGEPAQTANPKPEVGQPTVFESRELRVSAGLAFFSGACVIALEVLSLQLIDLSVPMCFYPPAAVLFCVILLLSVSAALVPPAVQRLGSARRWLPSTLAAAAPMVAIVPSVFLNLGGTRTTDLIYANTFAGFLAKIGWVALVTLGPAVLLCGLIFPLTLSMCSGTGPLAGRKLGLLLAINGLGGVIGAVLARSVLVPNLGVHVAIGTVGIGYATAALLFVRVVRSTSPAHYGLPVAGLFLSILVTVHWLRELPLFYWSNAYQVMEVRSGSEGVLAVFEREGFGRGLSFNNQYLLGGSGAANDEQRQSHIPLLLHPAPKKVFFAGLGTGITASGALKHEAVQSITAVELSQLVVDAAARHFGQFSGHFDQQTNVVIHVEDARTYLAACHDRFDVIIGDLFTPWRPGEAGLASVEYFKSSRNALQSGGVFCQWLPMHQLTEDQFTVILSTFAAVFPRTYLFRNHLKTSNVPLALIGFKDSSLDWATVRQRCENERRAAQLTDPLCRHAEGLAMLYFGVAEARLASEPINSLANLRIELSAGRSLVLDKPGQYFSYENDGNPWLDFMKSRRASWPLDDSIPEPYRALLEVGFLITRLEVSYGLNHPASGVLERQLRFQFPSSVLSDSGADWSRWAGHAATLGCLRPEIPAPPPVPQHP